MRPAVLSVAGSDPSGGAGIQADLKTFHAHGVYGAAVVTLLTVQNTRGCSAVELVPPAFVADQLDAVVDDIRPAVIKTGALGQPATVRAIAQRVRDHGLPLIVDPVRLASATTSGSREDGALLREDARDALLDELLPLATLVTPNLAELAFLLGGPEPKGVEDATHAALQLADRVGAPVLLKGGHLHGDPIDVFARPDGSSRRLHGDRVSTTAGHGTGCALASSIAARLAMGVLLEDASIQAKSWVARALASAPTRGEGAHPLDLFTPTETR